MDFRAGAAVTTKSDVTGVQAIPSGNLRPVVVAGVGRSGTSLVQAMLHAHPAVSFLPETHFFRRYVGPKLTSALWCLRGPDRFAERLGSDPEFDRAGFRPSRLLAPFLSGEESFQPARAYRRLLALHGRNDEVTIVGDKDPRLIDYFPALQRLVPRVRVVHVIRDPRDVLVSRREAAWSRDRSDASHLLAYRAQMRRGRTTGRRYLGDRYLELRYEDLLREPEGTLSRLCEHVGVQYHSAMMSFGEPAGELVTDEEWQWKKETTGPLKRDNIANWKNELTRRTLRMVERICIDPFPDLGYSTAATDGSDDIGVGGRLRLRSAQMLVAILSRLYPLRTLAG